MKKIKLIITLSLSLILICLTPQFAQAASTSFSVKPILPASQIAGTEGYFNLLLKPGQKENIQFQLLNSSDKAITVETKFATASTSDTGTAQYITSTAKPDSSLRYKLADQVQLPSEVKIPAHASSTFSAQVTMPQETFTGVLAGGFSFKEKNNTADDSNHAKDSMAVKNEYRYVVALIIRQNQTAVSPALSLHTVQAAQLNGRNIISANIENSAMAYLLKMKVLAKVQSLDDKKIHYDFDNSLLQMAPNSNFNLAIPVSLSGVLKDKHSQPLKPGKYHLSMNVYGNPTVDGKYSSITDGKTTNYAEHWTFERDFTISPQKAKKLNASDVTIKHSSPTDWLMIVGILIVVLLLVSLLLQIAKRYSQKSDH